MVKVIRLLKLLHLNSLFFNIEMLFVDKTKKRNIFEDSIEAYNYLNSIYKDNGQSCVSKHTFQSIECELSIIIPCYNSEKYIEDCLNSIISQKTKFNYEIIVVNDGSTDKSYEILQKYGCIDNVRIINQENQGLSAARNKGLCSAKGRYLLFVDSDDMLVSGSLNKLLSLAVSNNPDIIDSGHKYFIDSAVNRKPSIVKKILFSASHKNVILKDDNKPSTITGYPWGKFIKRQIFNNVQFPIGYWFEDTVVWMVLEQLCVSKITTSTMSILYRMNPNSICHSMSNNYKTIDSLYVTLRLLEDREKLKIKFDEVQYDKLLQQMVVNFLRIRNLPNDVLLAAFTIESNLILNNFSEWHSRDAYLKKIEKMLRTKDFNSFMLWVKWN